MRDEADTPDVEYEYQVRVQRPGETDWKVMNNGRAGFTKLHQRFTGHIAIDPSGLESGILNIENRVRKAGVEEWISQVIPIPVTVDAGTVESEARN